MPTPSFVFNDETVKNSHGFRLLNSGGRFERFNDNPVMLDTHDPKSVIGKWGNLKVEGSKLIAEPVFDLDDDLGKRIAGKVERGFLKAVSMGIYIEEAQYMSLPNGDLDLVVTAWELLEGSVLGVPSNRSALAFYSREGTQLSADQVLSTVQQLAAPTHPNPNLPFNMNKIVLSAEAATVLGVAMEHDDPKAINAGIMALGARAEKAEADLTAFKKERATTMVDLAIAEGRLDATRKESFISLATDDFKQASDILAAIPAKQNLSGNVKQGEQGLAGDRAGWDWKRYEKEDPKGLEQLRMRNPEEYDRLRFAYKGQYS
ncbi:MAG: HK97 family phage prohead protease [Bacteroidales bacterium]|nr:HK97 family phage prohead protease [Bacteroidales bacterium]